jgi:hypothetical protein
MSHNAFEATMYMINTKEFTMSDITMREADTGVFATKAVAEAVKRARTAKIMAE